MVSKLSIIGPKTPPPFLYVLFRENFWIWPRPCQLFLILDRDLLAVAVAEDVPSRLLRLV